jgi:hypothetical protein
MRFPWVQIAMEVIEQAAPDLATLLDWTEEAAGWGLVKMFRWALGRCPEDRPPSASAVIKDPAAARLLARAAGWKGDPDAFVKACASVMPDPLLELLPDGAIRIRGLGRYDRGWEKNHKEDAARWKAGAGKRREMVPESGTKPALNGAGSAPPDADADADTDAEEETSSSLPPPSENSDGDASDAPSQKEEVEFPQTADGFFAWAQRARRDLGAPLEAKKPKGFDAWYAEHAPKIGSYDLSDAYVTYLRDETISAPGHPTAVFITSDIWRMRLPRGASG